MALPIGQEDANVHSDDTTDAFGLAVRSTRATDDQDRVRSEAQDARADHVKASVVP